MNELDTARIVREHLDYGVESISPATLVRISASRELALARQGQCNQLLAKDRGDIAIWIKQFIFGRGYALRNLAFAIVMVLGVGFAFYVSNEQKIDDLAEIDSALLTDVLPIDAFTDRGFDAWLKNSSVQQSS